MTNIVISTTPHDISLTWVIYALHDGATAQIKYIGLCRLTELFRIPDARSNILFDQMFTPDTSFLIRVISTHKDKSEASTTHRHAIYEHNSPEMNGASSIARHANIQCLETGETFVSASHACRSHGLSQPALSSHLNGKTGYATVKGRKYIRVKR